MTPNCRPCDPALTPRDWYVALGLVALTMLVGSWYMIPRVAGVFHDDGIYLSTAKALAEGRGYRLINLPDAPPQTKYPPLYPFLLAIVWKIFPVFPNNLVFLQYLTLFCGALVVGLAYLYLVRFGYFSRGVAAGAGALTLTSVFYIYFSTITLSELPFALTVLAALWALEKQDENPLIAPGRQFLLGVLLGLPMLVRTIGGVFVPLGLWRLWKKGTPLPWALLGMALLVLPWLAWMLLIPRWQAADSANMYYTNYLAWWYSSGRTGVGQIILDNTMLTAMHSLAVGLGLFHPGYFSFWNSALAFILGLITWVFVVKDVVKGRILPVFLVLNLLIILVWPWPPLRFLVPLAPFLLAYFLSWVRQVLQRVPLLQSPWLATLLLTALLAVNVSVMARMIQVSHAGHYPLYFQSKESVTWQAYEDLFTWIKTNTQPGDVIASGLDTMIFLYTDRPAFRPFKGRPVSLFYGSPEPALGPKEEILQFLKRHEARFLVQLPMPVFSEEPHFAAAIGQILSSCPGLLKPVYTAPDSRFLVYEIDWAQQADCAR